MDVTPAVNTPPGATGCGAAAHASVPSPVISAADYNTDSSTLASAEPSCSSVGGPGDGLPVATCTRLSAAHTHLAPAPTKHHIHPAPTPAKHAPAAQLFRPPTTRPVRKRSPIQLPATSTCTSTHSDADGCRRGARPVRGPTRIRSSSPHALGHQAGRRVNLLAARRRCVFTAFSGSYSYYFASLS